MEIRTQPFGTLVAAVLDRLASGHRTTEELAHDLGDLVPSVRDPAEFLHELLSEEIGVAWQPVGLYRPDVLFAGTTFVTIPTEQGISAERIAIDDLPQLRQLERCGFLGDDYRVDRTGDSVEDLTTWLVGPPGWLTQCRPGHACALSFDGTTLNVVPSAPSWSNERMSELATSLAAAVSQAPAVQDLGELLAAAMLSDPTIWRGVVPPLDTVVDAAGLQRRGELIGDASTDRDLDTDALATMGLGLQHSLGESDRDALMVFAVWLRATSPPDYEPETDANQTETANTIGAAALLSQGWVAVAAWDLLRITRRWDANQIRAWAEAVESEIGSETPPAGLLFMLALCDLEDEDIAACEQQLLRAKRSDPDHGPTNNELGWIAFHRGNFPHARRLLDFSRVDDELAYLLDDLTRPITSAVGRNDACPCGSGRKFKRCHADRNAAAPLETRVEALMTKISRVGYNELHDVMGPVENKLWDVDESRCRAAFQQLHAAGLGNDVDLYDGGRLDRFIRCYGPLLPADELALAQSWLDTPLTVLEIDEVDVAASRMTARDLVRDTVLEIGMTGDMGWLESGVFVLARPLPVESRWVLFDTSTPIHEDMAAEAAGLLASGGVNGLVLAEAMAEFRPEWVEPVVVAARLRTPDPSAVASWIDANLEPDNDSDADTQVAVRDGATVIRNGDELTLIHSSIDAYELMVAELESESGPLERVREQAVLLEVLVHEVHLLYPEANEHEISEHVMHRMLALEPLDSSEVDS